MPRISTDNYDTVASWNGSQDLFIVEQPDGTKVATPAMVKQYVLGNSIDDIYSVMGQNGAKNLLVPEWVETKTIENGVTYTFNDDGTIIMNTDASGATANTNCNLRQNTVTTNNVFPAGTYTLTACPAGGSSTTYRTWARAYRPGTTTALTSNLYDEGNGVSFTVSEPFSLGLNVTVMKGYVCNNLTWKPMLRYASDTDNTYQPYAKTNRQLTEVIGDLSQTGLTGDSVAEQLGDASGKITGINSRLTSMNSFRIGSITGSSGTLVQQCVAFAQNIKNTYGMTNAFEGMFFYSASSRPSDIPANETIWTYASGKFLIRAVDGNNNVDATIILFAYGTSKIAIKTVSNSAQASNWSILGA